MYFQAHGAEASEVGNGTGLMFSRRYVCFQPCRLEDVNVRPPTSGRKMFPRALAKRNGFVPLQQDEDSGFRHVDCTGGEGRISKTAVSRRHYSRVQMKPIYSIKQLRHSSNVGGATQHNGWHRSKGHTADTVEVSKLIQDIKAMRQVIADRVATSGHSDARGIMWSTEMQKRPQINLFARERGKAPG